MNLDKFQSFNRHCACAAMPGGGACDGDSSSEISDLEFKLIGALQSDDKGATSDEWLPDCGRGEFEDHGVSDLTWLEPAMVDEDNCVLAAPLMAAAPQGGGHTMRAAQRDKPCRTSVAPGVSGLSSPFRGRKAAPDLPRDLLASTLWWLSCITALVGPLRQA